MKSHYIQSQERLIEGTNQVALCGMYIPKATWVFMVDIEAEILDSVDIGRSLRDCRFCRRAMFESSEGRRFIYAMVPGEEARQAEAS